MTIDEAITMLKFNNKHIADLKNDDLQQLAEWLEELKKLRQCTNIGNGEYPYFNGFKEGKQVGYNKAIDDFVRFANTMPTIESEDGEIRPMWLEEIAEQLKAGGKNDKSI